MSVRSKLLTVLLVAVFAFSVSIGVLLWANSTVGDATEVAVESQAIVVQALRVGRNASEQKRDARQIVLHDMNEEYEYERHELNVLSSFNLWEEAIYSYAESTGDEELREERLTGLALLKTLYIELDSKLDAAIADKQSGSAETAFISVEAGIVEDYESDFLPQLESLIETEQPRAEQAAADAQNKSSTARTVAIAVILGCALIIVLVLAVVIRDLTSSMVKLKTAAVALGSGDLSARADLDSRDEFGSLAAAFNSMASEVQASHDALERANAELAGFAHTVSHDLKGPVSALVMAGDTLRHQVEDIDETSEGLGISELSGIITSSSRKVASLIDDMLELAEAGQAPREVVEADVGEVIASVLEDRAPRIEEDGIRVNVDDDLGKVLASPTHLYQVFSNLIGNAIKHNDNPEPEIRVSRLAEEEPGARRYLVRDNGPGIPDDDIAKVFIPFFKGVTGETGIGLSTVEKIVTLYGGEIRAYNDNGACFEFTLRDYPVDSDQPDLPRER